MEIKRVLVTGSEGYIGSTLVPLLLSKDFAVKGIDTGYFNQTHTKRNLKGYEYLEKDIRKVSANDLKDIDAVIHLAALSNDPMGEIQESLTYDINFESSIRLAKLAKSVGVKRFIFSSSCSVYGLATKHIVTETSAVNPLTAYAKSKILTENGLRSLADKTFHIGLLRNSTVYGYSPNFRNDLVVNNFVTCALATSTIKVKSDGTPWRPLIDVRDLAEIFSLFLTTDVDFNNKIINIGFNENNVQVKGILNIIAKIIPSCSIEYTGEHGADTRSYRVGFDTFHTLFPKMKQKWNLECSIMDLVEKMQTQKYSKKDFDSGRYTRISQLKQHLDNNLINSDLFWN